MTYEQYLSQVQARAESEGGSVATAEETTAIYHTATRLQWLGTTLKMFSFLTYQPAVTAAEIRAYSASCHQHTKRQVRGLQRLLLTGAANISVLVTDKASPDAIAFATAMATKRGVITLPVIVDLTAQKAYYSTGIIPGAIMFQGYLRRYIAENFGRFER